MSSLNETALSRPLLRDVQSSFALLAGRVELPVNGLLAAQKLLVAAGKSGPEAALEKLETCTRRFAEACQRYDEKNGVRKPGSQGLDYYARPNHLKHMAQAMPYRVVMPKYFHDARWPFQFALREAEALNPRGEPVQGALRLVRNNQAGMVRRLRREEREFVASHLRQQVEDNRNLLQPFEDLRKAMRREALNDARARADVVALPVVKAMDQAERRPDLRLVLSA